MNLQIQENCKWQASPYLPDVTWRQVISWGVNGILFQVLLAYFFYQSWNAVLWLFPVGVVVMYRQWKNWQKRILLEIEAGFKDWLYYVKNSISAGKSFEQAMLSCRAGFYNQIGERHPLRFSLEQLYRGLELHMPVGECIRKFGEETGVDTVMEFAVIFEIARKQGGRMAAALERTIQQIYARIELRQEIQAMIHAKKLEQQIMCIMPFGILLFIGKTSGGYFTPLYHNVQGVLIMSICMSVYIFGVWWGEKLTEVDL